MVNQYVKGMIAIIIIGSLLSIYIVCINLFADKVVSHTHKIDSILQRNNTTTRGMLPNTLSDFDHPIDPLTGIQRFSTEAKNGS